MTLILDNAILHRSGGHGDRLAGGFGPAGTFIIREEVEPVLLDRTTQRPSEYIPNQFWRLVTRWIAKWRPIINTILLFSALHAEIVCAGVRVAMIFVGRAVEIVRSALGDQRDLATGSTALVSIVICGRNAKLLYRVQCHGKN